MHVSSDGFHIGWRGPLQAFHRTFAPLRYDFACVECNKHSRICLELFDGNGQLEVVQAEELKFQMIKLWQR